MSEPSSGGRRSRRDDILTKVVELLKSPKVDRITTALLAKEVGVSEAAIYRHFKGKGEIFEGLMDFMEQSLLGALEQLKKSDAADVALVRFMEFTLRFVDQNKGIARLLDAELLRREAPESAPRSALMSERLQAGLKNLIQQGQLAGTLNPAASATTLARIWVDLIVGRALRFSSSNFKELPLDRWDEQRSLLYRLIAP